MNGSLQTLERPTHTPATNALSEALERFDRAAVRLGLDPGTTGLLRAPMREHRVRVSVRMDAGTMRVRTTGDHPYAAINRAVERFRSASTSERIDQTSVESGR